MFGVGMNPVYLERLEERAAKKEANGQAAKEREEAAKAESVAAMNSAPLGMPGELEDATGVVLPTGGVGASEPGQDFFAALYGSDPYGIDGEEAAAAAAAERKEAAAVAKAEREAAELAEREAAEAAAEEEARLARVAAESALAAGIKAASAAVSRNVAMPSDAKQLKGAIEAAVASGVCGGELLDSASAWLVSVQEQAAERPLVMALRRAISTKGLAELMELESRIDEAEGLVAAEKLDAARVVLQAEGKWKKGGWWQ